jgi:hypothetical protein
MTTLPARLRVCLPVLLLLLLPAAAPAGPRLALSVNSIDFGRLPQHQVATREIRISNRGDAELQLTEVYTSCTCTELLLAAERIAPGGETLLTVNFHSRDLSGDNSKTIEISSNDPQQPMVEIPVLAFVAAPILVEPADRQFDFGKVHRGEVPRREAAIRVDGRPALKLELGPVDAKRFEVKLEPGAAADRARLVVGLKADAVAGPFRQVLRLVTDDPRMPSLDFTLSGTVLGDLETAPDRLNFRYVVPGQALSKELVVKSKSPGLDFRVTDAKLDLQGMVVEVLADGSGGEARLRVTGKAVAADDPLATAGQGRVKGSLRIFTNRAEEPELLVDLLYILRE